MNRQPRNTIINISVDVSRDSMLFDGVLVVAFNATTTGNER